METAGNIHSGHRERLKQSFLESGLSGFNEITTLELLLFYAIPRKDTNPIAHALLRRFRDLDGVFHASVQELTEVEGIGENTAILLKLIYESSRKAAISRYRPRGRILRVEDAAAYLAPCFLHEPDEKFMLVTLDSDCRIIARTELARGVVNAVDANVRLVVQTALQQRATSVIVAHNHPDGNLFPSNEDQYLTDWIHRALGAVDIEFTDHLIFHDQDYLSFSSSPLYPYMRYRE